MNRGRFSRRSIVVRQAIIIGLLGIVLAGAASDLYLWVWNRPPIGDVVVSGDPSLVAVWKDTVHVRWS